jgi:hypothetical protein
MSAAIISGTTTGSSPAASACNTSAALLNLTPLSAFTQPIVRFDLDRMDDDDNRLFGITAQIAWTPKPSYQLTLRTPLYAIKN